MPSNDVCVCAYAERKNRKCRKKSESRKLAPIQSISSIDHQYYVCGFRKENSSSQHLSFFSLIKLPLAHINLHTHTHIIPLFNHYLNATQVRKNLMIDMFSRLDRCLAKASTHLLYRRRRRERRESSFYLSIFLSVNIQFVGVMSDFCLHNSIRDMTIGERNKTRTKISKTIATSGSLYIKVRRKFLPLVLTSLIDTLQVENEIDVRAPIDYLSCSSFIAYVTFE